MGIGKYIYYALMVPMMIVGAVMFVFWKFTFFMNFFHELAKGLHEEIKEM